MQETNRPIVKIVADSSCDSIFTSGINFSSAPLTIFTDEKSFRDDENIDVNEMISYLGSYRGRSYTSCPNMDDWLKCYDGADIIYVVTLSSALSGSYNSAIASANIYKETHPNVKIHVFNSRSAGSQVRMLVDKIAEYIKTGKTFEEVCFLAEEYLKHTRIFFSLESFNNLAKNGRINKVIAKIAAIFGVRVIATGSVQGDIKIIKKFRGRQDTLYGFLNCMEEAEYTGKKCYIAHCQNVDFANEIAETIYGKYPDAEINVYETRGLCSYYAEKGGIILSCECKKSYE